MLAPHYASSSLCNLIILAAHYACFPLLPPKTLPYSVQHRQLSYKVALRSLTQNKSPSLIFSKIHGL